MAVRKYDMDPDRNVLNTKDPDDNTGFVIKTDEDKRKIGKGALPVNELRKWIDKKRKQKRKGGKM